MTRTERNPYQRLTLLNGLVAAFIWTGNGLRAVLSDNEPSGRALFACAAWVLAGFALGSVTWLLAAPRRVKSPAGAVMFAGMRAPNALLGIMLVGLAAGVILDPSPSAWGWASLVAGSLLGGVSLGIAFMAFAQPDAPSVASGQPTGASQPGG